MAFLTDNIIELNRDVEPFVIQASRPRSPHCFQKLFGDKAVPLAFVHASDMHADLEAWNRMVEYVNHYQQYLSFVLHTGDYCGGSQKIYQDLYTEGTPCALPVYNCVGNHDCEPGNGGWVLGDKADTHRLLFGHQEGWNAVFMDCEHSMSYYADFPESCVRMIVLDAYYDIWPTRRWLAGILEDAREKGLHVVTAMHEWTDRIAESFGASFHTMDDYRSFSETYERARTQMDFDHRGRVLFEDIITGFIQQGGVHVCHLAGHEHFDAFGTTPRGVLNVVVANGTTWDNLGDSRRVKGTRSADCFNVVAVDTDLGLLKLIRIGDNVDHYMRKKTALCFDYLHQRMVWNG